PCGVWVVASDCVIAGRGSAVRGVESSAGGGAPESTVIVAVIVVESVAVPLAPKSPMQSNVLPEASTVVFAAHVKAFVAATAMLEAGTPVAGSATRTTAPGPLSLVPSFRTIAV